MKKLPLVLYNMRVERTYTGGKLLDQWQGINPPEDGWMPEEWVASMIRSRYAPDPDTGLSIIRNKEEDGTRLIDYVHQSPEEILGRKHFQKFGENPGFLTKIIDSDKRLNIQTHPNRVMAKRYFNSDFGKTEAWYVMDTREIEGEDAYILLGFKKGISRKKWVDLIEKQDIDGLVNAMHKIPVSQSDVFLLESGVPHAIGSGCMIAEIQEPTDFTFRVEKISAPGKTFPEETYHQGIGYENMYDCFDYTGYSEVEVLSKMKIASRVRETCDDYSIVSLIRTENTQYFSMEKIVIQVKWDKTGEDSFSVGFVLNGSGVLHWNSEKEELKKGEEFFLPSTKDNVTFVNNGDEVLEVLMCYPPGKITR